MRAVRGWTWFYVVSFIGFAFYPFVIEGAALAYNVMGWCGAAYFVFLNDRYAALTDELLAEWRKALELADSILDHNRVPSKPGDPQ